MAPAPITEDYYMILEVEQAATLELVIRSYKRLALKLHPDRNTRHDSTEAFQLLGRAYETLKNEDQRRAYDLIYPSIARSRSSPQNAQTTRPSSASTSKSGAHSEAAQIAALQKSMQERGARWWAKKNAFDSSIFELRRDIRRLEQEIKNLDSIVAAEAAEEAQKNSWAAWFLSQMYKKVEDNEEEKARKARQKQERRIEKDMKDRRLELRKEDLKKEESLLRKAKEEVDAADLIDNGKILLIKRRIWARENWERLERERIARMWKQQREQEQEATEAFRKQQAEERAAEQKRQEERAITSMCRHDGWWSKVQGRTACPECYDIWTYLLQCPSCKMKACPRCQGAIRPRILCNSARANRRDPQRMENPCPEFFCYDY